MCSVFHNRDSSDLSDLSAEMILGVQLVGVLVTKGVSEQVHPGPRVEHLKSFEKQIFVN